MQGRPFAADPRRVAIDTEREAIIVTDGLPPGEPMTAQDGEVRWTRREGETLDVFKARVMAEPAPATAGFVVFGGLPH